MKKRILWVGESSETNSGYANYSKNILKRLHETGKYEIFELACFGHILQVMNSKNPWKMISNLPNPTIPSEVEEFEKNQQNSFGFFRFNDVLTEIKPDIVIDIRDWWMISYQSKSPLRQYYKWLTMMPIDSIPQPTEFISGFKDSDGVLSYTNWGKLHLEERNVKCHGVASPAADYSIFKPLNQKECRKTLSMNDSDIILLTVMRNQPRKQFPELIEAFSHLLNSNLSNTIKSRLKLHLHCRFPDNGWNLSSLILKNKVAKNILMTYCCDRCNHIFVDRYQEGRTFCTKCWEYSAYNPSAAKGTSDQVLSYIYNAADLYVQYSSCEGFGMPIVEAAACGLKTFGTDYSATSEVVSNCGGEIIKVRSYFYDQGTELIRSLPDNLDFVEKISPFIKNRHVLKSMKNRIANLARKMYSYDDSAKQWESLIDSIPDNNIKWTDKYEMPKLIDIDENINVDNSTFVRICLLHLANRSDLCDTYWESEQIEWLNFGFAPKQRDAYNNDMSSNGDLSIKTDFTRKDFIEFCKMLRKEKDYWERKRCESLT